MHFCKIDNKPPDRLRRTGGNAVIWGTIPAIFAFMPEKTALFWLGNWLIPAILSGRRAFFSGKFPKFAGFGVFLRLIAPKTPTGHTPCCFFRIFAIYYWYEFDKWLCRY